MGSKNKNYWLGNISTNGFNTRFCHTYEIKDSSNVTLLARELFSGSMSGLVSDTNIGEIILSLSAFPLNSYALSRMSWQNLQYFVSSASEFVGGGQTSVQVRNLERFHYYHMGQWFCGKIKTFEDFKPYTNIKVFLPFYGYVELNAKDIMNKWVQFRMTVDFLTGSSTYIIGVSDKPIRNFIFPENSRDELYDIRIISTVTFNLSINIPLSYNNANELHRNMIFGIIKTGIGALTGQWAMAANGAFNSSSEYVQKVRNPNTNRMITSEKTTEKSNSQYTHSPAEKLDRAVSSVMNIAGAILNNFSLSTTSSNAANANNMLNCSTMIHIIFEKAKILPRSDEFNHLYGRPLGQVKKLSEVSGYTKISNVHIDTQDFSTTTQDEINMLKRELLSGVYL